MMSVYDELSRIETLAGEQQSELEKVADELSGAIRTLKSLNAGDEIGEVMDEIKVVIDTLEEAKDKIY